MGAAGVTAGVQTPVTLVVGAGKATLIRRTLSGSTPVGDSLVWGAGITRIPQRISATRRTLLHRRAMQQHSLHQAVLRGGVRTHGGVRGHVPRPIVGSN